jgi:hypothetical protein
MDVKTKQKLAPLILIPFDVMLNEPKFLLESPEIALYPFLPMNECSRHSLLNDVPVLSRHYQCIEGSEGLQKAA